MSLYGRLFHDVAFRAWESGVRGRGTFEHLALLDRTQWMAPEELRAFQATELRRLIRHAYENVPYYGDAMRARDLTPDDVTRVEELSRLPILTKDLSRATLKTRGSTVAPRVDIKKTTGGTTGEPLVFGFDRGSETWRHAVKMRGWGWTGYRVGEKTFYYWGVGGTGTASARIRAKVAIDRGVKRERYHDCTVRSDELLEATRIALRDFRPKFFVCYTQGGVDLARYILDRGLREWDDIAVICCAERLDPLDRPLLERAFGRQVFETYGCREVMLIATECEAHDGLHTSMENLVVEIVVREGEQERPARPGEMGEVVITDLHNYGMPFIRYANGDLAIAGGIDRCRCGRGLLRLSGIEGRVAETFRDASGARVCGILFSRIFAASQPLSDRIRHWQAVQHRDGSLTLKVELARPLDAECNQHLERSFRQYLEGLKIDVEEVAVLLPGANGKRRTVVVES